MTMQNPQPRRQISPGRKAIVYLGRMLMAIGGLMCLSTFCLVPFEMARGPRSFSGGGPPLPVLLFFPGLVLLFIGGMVSAIGMQGAAGSGLVVDPEQARKDLEPLNRLQGGMLKDTLDEAGLDLGGLGGKKTERVVMIKCRGCGRLNEEDSKFCQECGQAM